MSEFGKIIGHLCLGRRQVTQGCLISSCVNISKVPSLPTLPPATNKSRTLLRSVAFLLKNLRCSGHSPGTDPGRRKLEEAKKAGNGKGALPDDSGGSELYHLAKTEEKRRG